MIDRTPSRRGIAFVFAPVLVVATMLSLASASCGTKPPSLGDHPLGGPMNTGGTPDPKKTNADNVGPGGKVNTGGTPDPSKTNADTPVAGGKPNAGGAPDISKSSPLKDAGK